MPVGAVDYPTTHLTDLDIDRAASSTPADEQLASAQPELRSLTGLRFVAAFLVLGYHYLYYLGGDAKRLLLPIFGRGGAGVGMFFILSGFVLMWSRRPHDTARSVYVRRAARILPAYVLAWALAGVVAAWLHQPLTAHGGVLTLLLLQAWVPDPNIYWGWNSVAWSLSCEAFFYLLFPLISIKLMRRTDRQLLALAVVLPLVTIAAAVVASHHTPLSPPLGSNLGTVGWLVYICPLARLPEFVLGCVLALLLSRGRARRIPVGLAVMVTIAGYAAAYQLDRLTSQTAVLVIPFALLITALAQADVGRAPSRTLANRALVQLGVWSYGFYLFHGLVLQSAEHYLTPPSALPDALLGLAGIAAGAVVVAALSHRLVERPINVAVRRPKRPVGVSTDNTGR